MKPCRFINCRVFIIGVLASCLLCYRSASAERFDFDAYLKVFLTGINRSTIRNSSISQDKSILGSSSVRLRLDGHFQISNRFDLDASYDLSPRLQNNSLYSEDLSTTSVQSPTYRAVDFEQRIYPNGDDVPDNFAVSQNLDRLHLTYSADIADVIVGRQAIAWGSARTINPTDIISPYAYNELDVEERIGVDAIRVRAPLDMLSEIDVGHVFGEDFDLRNSATYARLRFNHHGNDISLLAMCFRQNALIGADFTRGIGGAGFRTEGAYVFTGAFAEAGDSNCGPDYFRLSIGADYSLRNGTYLFAEYHYNGAGSSSQSRYLTTSRTVAYTEGFVYLLGRHFITPGIMYPITPLITASAQTLFSITDQSVLLSPNIEYNAAVNVYISAGAYIGVGPSPIYRDSPIPQIQLGSEFGSYPDIVFASMRLYL